MTSFAIHGILRLSNGDLSNYKGHGETELNRIFISRYLSVVKSSFAECVCYAFHSLRESKKGF